MTNLNKSEKTVLEAILKNAQECSGGDFAIGHEVVVNLSAQLRRQVIAGYISRLQVKGYIYVSGPAGEVNSQITIRKNTDGTPYSQS